MRRKNDPPLRIETPRLELIHLRLLRHPRRERQWIGQALRIYRDPRGIWCLDHDRMLYDCATLRKMYRWLCEEGEMYLIFTRSDHRLVGDITDLGEGGLPIYLAPEARGLGYAKEVVASLLRALPNRGFSRTTGEIYSFNHASRALFASLGFARRRPTAKGLSMDLR